MYKRSPTLSGPVGPRLLRRGTARSSSEDMGSKCSGKAQSRRQPSAWEILGRCVLGQLHPIASNCIQLIQLIQLHPIHIPNKLIV